MAERFSSDLLFIVIVLLIAAILGFLIGYFWRKRKAAEEVETAEPLAEADENILTASAETHEIIEKVNYETAVAEEIMEMEIGSDEQFLHRP